MGIWNVYFIIKFFLYFGDHIDFHLWLNLAFAGFLLIPLRSLGLRLVRSIAAIPLAIALFYHDTRFPPLSRLIDQYNDLKGFNGDYLLDLASRFFDAHTVMICAGLVALYVVLARKLRVTTFVLLVMCTLIPLQILISHFGAPLTTTPGTAATLASTDDTLGIAPAGTSFSKEPTDQELTRALGAFYTAQAARVVDMPTPGAADTPFDIIFIHVCSLSWDDLAFSQQTDNSLFKRFDILFRQFNSATSYSGPAAIRVLRSSCGQSSHNALYSPADKRCYLFEQFASAGFERELVMNHDGKFGNMIREIQGNSGLNVPLHFDGKAHTALVSFDGSTIKSDYNVLSDWLQQRETSAATRTALFYNTSSLHDGNHAPGLQAQAGTGANYPPRVKTLFNDVSRFIDDLEARKRRAVVVMISEHGAGAKGDRMQIPFMRENPSPAITNIPVGIVITGLDRHPANKPLIVNQQSSYIDLSGLLARLLARDPFKPDAPDSSSYLTGVEGTPQVAENEKIAVVQYGRKYYIRYEGTEWASYNYQ